MNLENSELYKKQTGLNEGMGLEGPYEKTETRETKESPEINYIYDITFNGTALEITKSISEMQRETNTKAASVITVIDGEKGVASATFVIEQKN